MISLYALVEIHSVASRQDKRKQQQRKTKSSLIP